MEWKMGRHEGIGRSWPAQSVGPRLAKLRSASTKTKQTESSFAKARLVTVDMHWEENRL